MNNNIEIRKLNWLTLAIVILSPLFFTSAHGFSAGFVNGGAGCGGCHNSGSIDISISGPTAVAINSTHTFTLTITGGPAVVGGFNVAAEAGLLSATQVNTGISDGQIIHTAPTAFSGNTVSWDFDWTAPDVLGAVDLMAGGISANSINGAAGDFSGITTFTIQVVPIPAGLLLFSSGLAVLGWVRRRSVI